MNSNKHQLVAELEDNHEFVLMMLDLPIAFHRAYIPMTGKVTSALMLSWAIQLTEECATHDDGWFTKTGESWTMDIGLSTDELKTARKRLEELGLIEVRREKSGETPFRAPNQYRVNFKRLDELLRVQAQQIKQQKSMH